MHATQQAKKAAHGAGAAAKHYGKELESKQMVMMYLADMLIDLFAMESMILRTQRAMSRRCHRARTTFHDTGICL